MRNHLLTGDTAPIVGPGAGALLTLLAYGSLAGLAYAWRTTFGAALEWLADRFDALSFHIPFAGRVRPFGPIAAAFRSVDHSIQHNLAARALGAGHAFWKHVHQLAHDVESLGRWAEHTTANIGHAFARFEHKTLRRWERRILHFAAGIVHAVVRPVRRFIVHLIRLVRREVNAARRIIHRVYRDLLHWLRWVRREARRTWRDLRWLERRLRRAERWIEGDGFGRLVALALHRLGLSWLFHHNILKLARSAYRWSWHEVRAIIGYLSKWSNPFELQQFARSIEPELHLIRRLLHNRIIEFRTRREAPGPVNVPPEMGTIGASAARAEAAGPVNVRPEM